MKFRALLKSLSCGRSSCECCGKGVWDAKLGGAGKRRGVDEEEMKPRALQPAPASHLTGVCMR